MAHKIDKSKFSKSAVFINGELYRKESIYTVRPIIYTGEDFVFDVIMQNGETKQLQFTSKDEAVKHYNRIKRMIDGDYKHS